MISFRFMGLLLEPSVTQMGFWALKATAHFSELVRLAGAAKQVRQTIHK